MDVSIPSEIPKRSCSPRTDQQCLPLSKRVEQVVAPTSLLRLPTVFLKLLFCVPHIFCHLSLTSVTDLWAVPTALTFFNALPYSFFFFLFCQIICKLCFENGFCLTSLWITHTSITLKFWLLALFGLEQTSLFSMFTKKVEGSGSAFWVIKWLLIG